jgi:outer membrane receptor for ferrienterochelin and colicin
MRTARAFACFLTVLALALPALGQGNPTGKIQGRVESEGTPLPGVTVTANSPALQGEQTEITTQTGDFLFQSLPPGDYRVTFELEGMAPLDQSVRVAAAQTARVIVTMGAAAVTETIVVAATAANETTISQDSEVATTFPKALVDELAGGRTINQIVALSPGVLPNGPSKSDTTGLSNVTISGAPTSENLFLLNGVVLNENIRGQAFDLFIEDAIQETTTATAGVSAEYGRFSGGVVNVITKSGGNDFSGSFRTTVNNQSWEEARLNPTTGRDAPQTDKTIPTYEATLGGPVLEDHLWFFLAGRDQENERSQNTAAPTSISFVNLRDQQRYEGKLTATITPKHSLLGSYVKIDDIENGQVQFPIYDVDSLTNRETPQELWSLNYTGSFGDNLLLTTQYSEREFTFIGSGSRFTDLLNGTLLLDRSNANTRYNAPTFCGVCLPEQRNNENLLVKASYFLSTSSLGTHDLVAGYDTFDDIRVSDNHQSGSDFRIIGTGVTFAGTTPLPIFRGDGSTTIQYDPILQSTGGTSFKTNSLFFNDSWRFNDRLTFNLGVRYDESDGTNGAGQKVADDSLISPRVAVSFDTHADGRLLFHASYGQYVSAIANGVADSSSRGGVPSTFQWIYRGPDIVGLSQDAALTALFDWFAAANGGLPTPTSPVGGGQVPVSGAAIRGLNTQIQGTLTSPNVTEFSVGASAQLGARTLVRADVVFREWSDFYHQRTDASTGFVVGQIGPVTQRFDLTLVENNENLYERTYEGLHTQFRYRASDRLDLGGNWTLSRTEGNYNAENQGSGPVPGVLGNYPEYIDPAWNSPSGPLTIDQRHRVNLYGVYRVLQGDRHDLSIGLLQFYGSGHPYEAVGTIRTQAFVDPAVNARYFQEPVRVNYFFSDRGSFTTPSVTATNLSLNYTLKLGSIELFAHPEVINVFNEDKVDTTDVRYFNTTVLTNDNGAACVQSGGGTCAPFNPFTETPVEGVHWVKGPLFGQANNPLAFQQPRTYRLSVGLRF